MPAGNASTTVLQVIQNPLECTAAATYRRALLCRDCRKDELTKVMEWFLLRSWFGRARVTAEKNFNCTCHLAIYPDQYQSRTRHPASTSSHYKRFGAIIIDYF